MIIISNQSRPPWQIPRCSWSLHLRDVILAMSPHDHPKSYRDRRKFPSPATPAARASRYVLGFVAQPRNRPPMSSRRVARYSRRTPHNLRPSNASVEPPFTAPRFISMASYPRSSQIAAWLVSTCHLQPQPAKRHVTRTPCCQSLITRH